MDLLTRLTLLSSLLRPRQLPPNLQSVWQRDSKRHDVEGHDSSPPQRNFIFVVTTCVLVYHVMTRGIFFFLCPKLILEPAIPLHS